MIALDADGRQNFRTLTPTGCPSPSDGYRGMLYLDSGVATFGSKRGNVLTRFRQLAEDVHAQLRVRNDGEVVALDTEGRRNFGLLLRSPGHLHYAAFDLVWLNGRDLRKLPLAKR